MESLSKHRPATLIVGVSGDMLEVARKLGREGERIGLMTRSTQLLYRYKEMLDDWQVDNEAFAADVSDSQGVLNAMMRFSVWSPRVDRLIYNVGVLSAENEERVAEGELAREMHANFFGFVNCFQLIQPMFQRLGGGHILVIQDGKSRAAEEQIPQTTGQASLRIYLGSLRKEVAARSIQISEVLLGRMRAGEGWRELTCEEIVDGVMRAIVTRPSRLLVGIEA